VRRFMEKGENRKRAERGIIFLSHKRRERERAFKGGERDAILSDLGKWGGEKKGKGTLSRLIPVVEGKVGKRKGGRGAAPASSL